MSGKYSVAAFVVPILAAVLIACVAVAPVDAYRICTFKGTVLDHGWRSMTVKSGTQCAEVNVGWRTKYLPNRRPCIGERVAVDFILEDGYMKATKVVSLSPLPPSVQCYPPAPPSTAVCRTVGEEAPAAAEPCPSPRAICSNKAPSHVANPNWSPGKPVEGGARPPKITGKKPSERKETKAPVAKTAPEGKEEPKESIPSAEDKKFKTLSGEVVASSPKSLSIRVMEEGEAAEVMSIRVGLKTKFIPFRRPAVGEKVKVEYRQENGDKFGYTVQVVQ
ncbi:MAG TPA: hypothetical protein VK463_04425 [Desulfomonilaceae bacterium]|nr:hypothetical protein [Desulfomonilaceae bacterium]